MDLFKDRTDVTRWCIHFVRDRSPEDIPGLTEEEVERNCPTYGSLEPDASAFSVLKNILYHSALIPGFSFRKGKTTVYGGAPVVCFTEMPIYQFAKYCQNRADHSRTSPYGIAILKSELYSAGGRPAIYGLSQETMGQVIETGATDRIINPDILPMEEQFRYVVYDPNRSQSPIDWTHEREWRWRPGSKPEYRDMVYMQNSYTQIYDRVPALPLFRGLAKTEDHSAGFFSRLRILVWDDEEANEVATKLLLFGDSESNNFSEPFNRDVLSNSSIVILDRVIQEVEKNNSTAAHRIEDLPPSVFYNLARPKATPHMTQKIQKAIAEARVASTKAAAEFQKSADKNAAGQILDMCGFAWVITHESASEVVGAMLELGLAEACWGEHYQIDAIGSLVGEQSITYNERGAEAAADVLTKALGIKFYCHSRPD